MPFCIFFLFPAVFSSQNSGISMKDLNFRCLYAKVSPDPAQSLDIEVLPVVMKKLSRFFYLLIILALVGGFGFLATWEIPRTTTPVEKIIPDERLPR